MTFLPKALLFSLISVFVCVCSPPAGAVTSADPVMTCHYSQANDRIDGEWLGGFPTAFNERIKQTGFTAVPSEVYNAKLTPRCNIVFDADFPLQNGSYTRTICAPLGQGTVPNTPACGNWVP